MKIAILGLSISSSWGNGHATTYRALLKALALRGHTISFYERDQPWYAAHRDLRSPNYCGLTIYRSLEELEPLLTEIAEHDAVVLGSFVPEGVKVGEMLLEAGVAPLAFYDIDTPVTLAALEKESCDYLTPALARRFDIYFSFSDGAAREILKQRYGVTRTAVLSCGVDTSFYRPADMKKHWKLGYLGTYSADRQPVLERLLIEPARRLPSCRFVVAGPQYPEDIRWPENVDRIEHVPPAAHPAFYSSLKFALNTTRSDMVRLGHSPSVRLFEASSCATPVISDPWTGLPEYFTPEREILVADTADDVVRLLEETNDAEAGAMGLAARARVLDMHDASRRAEQLEAAIRSLTGKQVQGWRQMA